MSIFAMLARSILSYTVFLASRKMVQGGLGAGSQLKKQFKLHRCIDCYRLYSGEISECTLCGSLTKRLYWTDEEEKSNYKTHQDFEKREGLERQVYNDTRNFNFEPLKAPILEVRNDRRESKTDTESGNRYKRRDRGFTGYKRDDRSLSA